MRNKLTKRIRLIYGAVLGGSIVIAGICLMAACLGIYDGGNGAFSREAVAEAFSPIALPVYLCLTLTVLGFPLNWLLRDADKKIPFRKQNTMILKRLHEKTALEECDPQLQEAVAAEARSRRIRRGICWGMLILSIAVFLVYVLTGDRFLLPDITSSMVRAMAVLLPCLAVTFGYSVYAVYRNEKSMEAEIRLMKQASASAPKEPGSTPEAETKMNLNTLRAAIVLTALAVLLFGYFTGGTMDVLTKAVNICTECIGLG